MTLEECYTAMGANYQDVLKRFYKSDMIRRFVKMFLQDDSFRLLTDAMAKQDVKAAFRAALPHPRLRQPQLPGGSPDGDPPRRNV